MDLDKYDDDQLLDMIDEIDTAELEVALDPRAKWLYDQIMGIEDGDHGD